MESGREVQKLKVIEGYREPGSKTFDGSADSIKEITVESGVEARVNFVSGKSRF